MSDLTRPPRRRPRWAGPLLALFLLAPAPPRADPPIRDTLRLSPVPGMRWGRLDDVRPALDTLYAAIDWRPLWLSGGRATPAAQAAVRSLATVDRFGLEPADYDAAALATAMTRLDGALPAEQARFEVILSAGLLRATIALSRGRIDPRRWYPHLPPPRTGYPPADLVGRVSRGERADSMLAAVQPQHPEYDALLRALGRLRETPPAPLRLPAVLRPGDSLAAGDGLARRLALLGALAPADTLAPAPRYDSVLVMAVRRFQGWQGLAADGIVGAATRARLEVPVAERIRQIELSLERWRWLPGPASGRYLEVNVPAQELTVRDGPSMLLARRVIVGKPPRHATPLLAAVVTGVQVHPPWRVPTPIAIEEVLPRLRRDPAILARDGFEFFRGDSLLPADTMLLRRVGRGIDLRQRPGPRNPLGRIKLVMPNAASIYLHDTPEQHLFERPLRTLSHGCVRVEFPVDLATLLLSREGATAPLPLQLGADTTAMLALERPVPVLITYRTAVATAGDGIAFFADLYGADRQLDAALRAGYPFAVTTGAAAPPCC